jgi:putative exosortase-associated protein (TIGR04073 family)
MVKKLSAVILAIALLAYAPAVYAAADDLVDGMAAKFWRGLVNTFTGWVEFPAQIIKGYNEGFMGDESNKILGVVVGIFEGLGHSAGRTFNGMTELMGFWAANPADNEGIGMHLDAEYAWEEGTPYDAFDPTFTEGAVMPVANKALRGLGNGFLGIAEVPGQIAKGISEGAPDLGIIKGIWYWLSRGVHGLSDVMTCLLPNPEDQKGLAFDEKWPWEALADKLQ